MAKTETKIIEIKVAFADGIRAIAEGQEAIKNLTAEQKQLNLATAEGVKRNAEITAAIKSHKDEINQLIPVIAEDIKKRGERASAIDRHVQAEVDLINKAMAKRNQEIAAREKEYARFNQRKVAEAQKENETAVAKEQSELKKQLADKRSDVLAAVSAKKKEGYINQLKITVNELEQEYYQLTEAELKSAKGTELLSSLKNKRAELMQLQQAYGNHTLNVGNYSSATKMLGINIGQVMKEMPNFAISARIGIMSLTNNLPMLAETIKQVRVEQLAMIAAGQKAPSMFSLISKSVFGLTGLMSILMVLMQLYGAELIKMAGDLFKANSETKLLDEASKNLQKTLKEGKNFYTEAAEKIIKMESVLLMAKNGTIDADAALEEYNKTLGDTFGKATSLSEALGKIETIRVDYINGIVAMAAAQELLTVAINKSSEALGLEQKGKPGFWDYVLQLDKIIGSSFNPMNWGIDAFPKMLDRIANLGKETYQRYYDDINKLRTESQKGVQAYYDEVKRITEKYKNDPFILNLLGLDSGKKTTKEDVDFKNTPAWKKFSAAYDARREAMELEEKNEQNKNRILLDLQASLGIKKTELTEKEIEKQNKLVKAAVEKGKQLLEDGLLDEAALDSKSVENKEKLRRIDKQNEINALSDRLETAVGNLDEQYRIEAEMRAFKMQEELAAERITEEQKKIIRDKYAKLESDAQSNLLYQKQQRVMQYVGAIADISSNLNNFMNALGERELQNYSKQINGKANYDELYEAKKLELEIKAAKRGKALAIFGTIISTASSIMAAVAAPPVGLGAAGVPLAILNGINGAAQIAAILATPLPSASGNTSGKAADIQTKTVTEKFHTGGTVETAKTGVETPATLLGGESVNTIATTQMFSPLLSALNQLGGGKAITSGVANTSLGTDMLASAFSKALRNMPSPILIMEEFEKASEKHKKIQNNRIIR